MEYFIDVILPIPLRKLFTYKVNKDEAYFLKKGMRVAVSFGKSKLYSAIVHSIHNEKPTHYEAKEIEHILDQEPIITGLQLQLWQWIAEYYMCSLGEVCRAALPNVFMLESETIVERTQTSIANEKLSDDEYLVYDALNYKTSLTVSDISKIIVQSKVLSVLNTLVEKKAIVISEKFYEKYVPKLVSYVRLHPSVKVEQMSSLFEELSNAPKQKELLLKYFNHINKDKKPVAVKSFLKKNQIAKSILNSLVEKKILEEYYLQKDRIEYSDDTQGLKTLSSAQEKAFSEIKESFKKKDTTLLHGVTSSGKTEIYVKLIQEFLQEEKQVLYLLPEIAITTQLITRLQKYFGNKVAVYHSKFTSNERAEVWRNVLNNDEKAQLVIGVRSSILLPFSNLGLIVVDEEHEKSYKQFDPAPRYHARDCAIVLSSLHKAKVLLGSATPSLETFYNAQKEKYALVNLQQRYADVKMPDIQIIDIKDKKRRKQMKGSFSQELLDEISKTLVEVGEQVILFQNRRGYAPVLECNQCGVSPQCPNCDVSLTYHQHKKQLRCHYCGYAMALPNVCPACSSTDLNTKGLGTEQVEQEIQKFFPESTVERMDQDTTRGKYGYDKIIAKFEQQETDILVGTQMVTKGLDFEKVRLVGVLNADNLLHFPEYKASERCFQTLTQVSGRSGRSDKQGKVLIQTHNPEHSVIRQVSNNDYYAMAEEQLAERAEFKYPPFVRLIKITFKHRDFNKVNDGAQWFYNALENGFHKEKGIELLGPEFPAISRIRNEYIKHILLKINLKMSLKLIKDYLLRVETSFHSVANFRPIRILYNVDSDG